MYAFFDGVLADIEQDNVVVNVNGIGVNIHVHDSALLPLPSIGDPVKFYTHTSVGEDKFVLFGFLSKEELELFKTLISMNGVGPKTAQTMIALLGVDETKVAIATEDVKTIAKTPGIGAKTAGRVINDLKDKMKTDFTTLGTVSGKSQTPEKNMSAKTYTREEEDCITALVNLGYSRANAAKAVDMVENRDGLSAEELLKLALRNVMFL